MANSFISFSLWTDDNQKMHPHKSTWAGSLMAETDKLLTTWSLAATLKSSSAKPALYARVSTTYFFVDTDLVWRLTGSAAWKRVSLRVKEDDQLQGG